MATLIANVLAALMAALFAGWRRDRSLTRAGSAEAQLRGLEDVNARAERADAAAAAARGDPDLLRDDGHRRD